MQNNNWKDKWKKEASMSYKANPSRPHRIDWKDKLKKYLMDPQYKAAQEKEEEAAKKLQEYEALQAKPETTPEDLKAFANANGFFSGALWSRNHAALAKASGERIPVTPSDVIRLHLELIDDWSKEDHDVVCKYGGLKGRRISRDVVVPADMPLYAMHFMIQRLFGWSNSHPHMFELPLDAVMNMTKDTGEGWKNAVGIVLRSPNMDEMDEYWTDDYVSGSFANWLRNKYIGPYLSRCVGEYYVECKETMKSFDLDEEYYVAFYENEGKEWVSRTYPVVNHDGKTVDISEIKLEEWETRIEKMRFRDMPVLAVYRTIYERSAFSLLERLPVSSVLHCSDDSSNDLNTVDELLEQNKGYFDAFEHLRAFEAYLSPECSPVTNRLVYSYDFGDGWQVIITATRDCKDLVENGKLTQEELDKANIKCRELYRPVTIVVDGGVLMDDVGGTTGYAEFLRTVNPEIDDMDEDEIEDAMIEKEEMLDWAREQEWKKNSPWI